MTCPRIEDLSALADDALTAREQAALRQHLHSCPVCRRQLQAFEALRRELLALPSPTLGFDLAAQLLDRLPRRAARPRRRAWGLPGWMPAGLAGAAALACGLWLGGLLLGAGATISVSGPAMVRVFDPVPPGGLCAAADICRVPKGMP